MALIRQSLRFLLVGALLIAADSAAFVALTWLGAGVHSANLIGRLSGAALGFVLHGGFTFADGDARLGVRPLRRYALLWLLLTALGTLAIGAIAAVAGLHWAWLLKPLLEVVLAAASFLGMRLWVFR